MSIKYGRIDGSETSFEENIFHKNQTLTSASEGVNHHFALKDHYLTGTTDLGGGLLSVSGSHWASIHTMFYPSGSTKISQSNPDEIDKWPEYSYWHYKRSRVQIQNGKVVSWENKGNLKLK